MAPRSRNTIVLDGYAREEAGIASGTITPGDLIEPTSVDGVWQRASSEGGIAVLAFARENRENNGSGIDDNISTGESFTVVFPCQGGRVFATVEGTVSRGDHLESNGAGKLQLHGSGVVVAICAKDSDNDSPLRAEVYAGVAGGFSV